MTRHTVRMSRRTRVLGTLGLVGLGLIGWACGQNSAQEQPAGHPRRMLAWLVLTAITAVGWSIDRALPAGGRQSPNTAGRSLSTR